MPTQDPQAADGTIADTPTLSVRTVWISDLHLGTPGCQAKALLGFLRDVECETLYLVGDIIDGLLLGPPSLPTSTSSRYVWPSPKDDINRSFNGARARYAPGNSS